MECDSLYDLWEILDNLVELEMIDCVIVNDKKTENYLQTHFDFSLALGERISNHYLNPISNNYLTGNEVEFGKNLFNDEFRVDCIQKKIQFVLCDMPKNGLCISTSEQLSIQARIGVIEEFDDACIHFRNGTCDGSCLKQMYTVLKSDAGCKLIVCANSICMINRISEGILKTI